MGGGSLAYISALNEIEDIAYCRDWAEARVAVFGMRGDWPGKRRVPLRLGQSRLQFHSWFRCSMSFKLQVCCHNASAVRTDLRRTILPIYSSNSINGSAINVV